MAEALKEVERLLNEFFTMEQNNRLTRNNFGFLMMQLRPLLRPEVQEVAKQKGDLNGLAQ